MTDPAGTPEIHLTDLTKHFRDVRAVERVSLDIRTGELFSMLGPSGCGKTTTLRMIGGFELPSAGRIELRGRDVTTDPPDKRPVNMVFQNYALFPHLDVAENIAFGLRRRRVEKTEIKRRVALLRDRAADPARRPRRSDARVRPLVGRPRGDLVQRRRRLDHAADLHLLLDQVRGSRPRSTRSRRSSWRSSRSPCSSRGASARSARIAAGSPSRTPRRPDPREVRQPSGTCFFGSMNGSAAVRPNAREPSGPRISRSLPGSASSIGTQT